MNIMFYLIKGVSFLVSYITSEVMVFLRFLMKRCVVMFCRHGLGCVLPLVHRKGGGGSAYLRIQHRSALHTWSTDLSAERAAVRSFVLLGVFELVFASPSEFVNGEQCSSRRRRRFITGRTFKTNPHRDRSLNGC